MEVLTERLVPNFVLLVLVLSFTTVTQGKFKYANYSNETKISALIPLCSFPLGKRNVSANTDGFPHGFSRRDGLNKK